MAVALPDLRSIDLDPGDLGLILTPQGFRPLDGIDLYPGKVPLCPVVLSMKNTATDRVEPLRACTGDQVAEVLAPVAHVTHHAGHVTLRGEASLFSWGCCAVHVTQPDPPVTLAPIPLPASGLLLTAALVALAAYRKAREGGE